MDPLSITASVLALLGCSITAIQSCQTFAMKYQIADLSISSMRTECACIKVSLLQIQSLISRTPARDVQDQFQQYVVDEYKAVLSACSLTFALLNERLEGLGLDKLPYGDKDDMRAKLRFLWNEAQMELIRQNIRGQATAVSLLLAAFQSETVTKSYEILMSQQAKSVLESVSSDAGTLRQASLRPRAERPDADTTGSVIGDEEFSFDDVVINSQAYRRAFVMQQRKVKVHSIQEEEAGFQISCTPSSAGAGQSRSPLSSEKTEDFQLTCSISADSLGDGGLRGPEDVQSPEHPQLRRNPPFLRRIFGKTSKEIKIIAPSPGGAKKLSLAKPSSPLKSESSPDTEKLAKQKTTTALSATSTEIARSFNLIDREISSFVLFLAQN